MTQMNIILDSNFQNTPSISEWLSRLGAFQSNIQPQSMTNVALPIKRMGFDGLLSDNPPIDLVDDFLFQLEKSSMQLGLISLPVSVNVQEPKLGEEISCINGWIDTAGYAGCSHIRFCAPELESVSDTMINVFREVCVYALDLYMQISFSGFDPQFVQIIREKLNQTQQSLIGLEYKVDGIDSVSVPDSIEDVPVSLVSINWQPDMTWDTFQSHFQSVTQPVLLQV